MDATERDWVVLDDGLRPAWESQVAARLSAVLGKPVAVQLELPGADDVREARETGATLQGGIVLREAGAPFRQVRLRAPLPFDGVFVCAAKSGAVQTLVWESWLAEGPGLRFVAPAASARRAAGVAELRLTFPDWKAAVLSVSPGFVYPGATAAAREAVARFLWTLGAELAAPHPHCLAPHAAGAYRLPLADGRTLDAVLLDLHGRLRAQVQADLAADEARRRQENAAENVFTRRLSETRAQEAATQAFVRQGLVRGALPWLEKLTAAPPSDLSAADDLSHRRLVTFPIWLASALAGRVHEFVANGWDVFDARHAGRLESGLVPVSALLSADFGAPCLVRVKPNSPLDLLSSIRGVRRFRCSADAVRAVSVESRQNHPSFDGRICPLETTESDTIGIALQLARGARVDGTGTIHSAEDGAGVSARLGWGAALIPFSHHNDGARNMMGAKNLRQAVPVAGRRPPAVRTGCEDQLLARMQALVDAGLCPDCRADGRFALGRDLLVAYLPWHGWNVDDALVLSRSAAAEMGLVESKHVSRMLGPEWEVEPGASAEVRRGDVIATLKDDRGRSLVIRYHDDAPATVTGLAATVDEKLKGLPVSKRLAYTLSRPFALTLGDKLQNRHGGKGVVGAVFDDAEMPRLPDDPRLGTLSGRTVDILVNPHGVLSRMNPGQLLETHLGWLAHAGTCPDLRAVLTDAARRAGLEAGCPEKGAVDHEKVRKLLARSGLDRNGRIRLRLPDGTETENPVVVGFQHFVRLHHVPSQKSQARRGGAGARYSEATRQAVHGRGAGGGQRVGEMEVWALAAHGADHVLEEMLGGKSDADWAKTWAKATGTPPPRGDLLSGFPSVLRDGLFALSIDMACADGKAAFRLLTDPAEVRARTGGDGHAVTSPEGQAPVWTTAFACRLCGWRPGEGRLAISPHGNSTSLSLRELLTAWGLACGPSVVRNAAGGFEVEVVGAEGTARLSVAPVRYAPDAHQLLLAVAPIGTPPAGWPEDLPKLTCARKSSQSAKRGEEPEVTRRRRGLDEGARTALEGWKSKDLPACLLLEDLLAGVPKRSLGDYAVVCPRHASTALAPRDDVATGLELRAAPGGVFDPEIFGGDGWGFIELPVPIPYPRSAFGGKDDPGTCLSVLPVLPLRYRRPAPRSVHGTGDQDLSALYQSVIRACAAYRTAKPRTKDARQRHLAYTVGKLFRRLADRLNGKNGLLRHEGLGRRVDRSCRLVITPNPELKWNEARLPAAVMWELFGDQVEAWERTAGAKKAPASSPLPEHEVAGGWSCPWRAAETVRIRSRLKAFLAAHPDYVMLFNRQPSLHRDSFLALHPAPLETSGAAGADVLQLSPLALEGLAGDFDGDEVAGHLPVTAAAQREAAGMLPDANLRSMSTGRSLAHVTRDFVTGTGLLHRSMGVADMSPAARVDRICRDAVGVLAVAELSSWARAAYDRCTTAGVSFGFYDLLDLARRTAPDARDAAGVARMLRDVLSDGTAASGCRTVAEMVLSEANGEKAIHQLVGARGHLDPGPMGYDGVDGGQSFDFPDCSLVDGMDWRTFFASSWNARSTTCEKKLAVGRAGDLTRHLVFALWPVKIVAGACGCEETKRSVHACACADGVCAACYGAGHGGLLPDGRPVAAGVPVGLLAAQAIGERGTQLAMKSMHAGASAVDIGAARRLFLNGRLDPEGPFADWPAFVGRVRAWDAYRKLDERHFEVLWRTLSRCAGGALSRAVSCDPGVSLAFQGQKRHLLDLALRQAEVSLGSPFLRVVFNCLGGRADLGGGS